MPETIKKVILRRATLKDIEDILAVEKSLDGMKIYSALTNRSELLEEITHHFFYVIEENGNVVGDISYELKDKNHAYISGLGIMPPFQGHGIARQAVKLLLEKLEGIKLIDLVTHPENEKSIHLYHSFGFVRAGKQEENYFGDGEPRIRMILDKRQ